MSEEGQINPAQGVHGSSPAKRQRVLSKACVNCKTKKLKCDSSRPCESCGKKGLDCIYQEKGQPGLRPGYGKDVERRLTALEEENRRINQILEQHLKASGTNDMNSTDLLNAEFQMPMARSSYETQPPPPNQPNAVLPLSGTQAPNTTLLPSALGSEVPITEQNLHPPAEILLELVDLFFHIIHPWAPLFHKPTFMAELFTASREILLCGVMVVTFPFWSKMSPSPRDRHAYVEASRKKILLHCTDACSIVSTQALALLAIDAVGRGPGTRMWNILSLLTASVQQLALMREPLSREVETASPMVGNQDAENENSIDATAVAAEERRRLFWTIFSIERFGSVALGQAGGIPTNSIKLRHPANDMDWSQDGLGQWFQPSEPIRLGPSSRPWDSYIELLSLLDRSNRLLIRPFDFTLRAHREEWQCSLRMLDVTLSTWLENAPPQCRDRFETFEPMWMMVRATFELIRLRLYTVAAFPSGSSSELQPSASARVRCRESIRIVTMLASGLKPEELDRLGPTFAFVVWVAARSLVILWTSGYEGTQRSTPADLESLMSVLRTISRRWPCAGRSLEMIKLVLDNHGEPAGVNYLKIFSDTRRTSYGLEVALSRASVQQEPTEPDIFDLFDMNFTDVGDMNPFLEAAAHSSTQDWLG